MSVLIWVQTVSHSDSVPKITFEKNILKKVSRRQQKYEKLRSLQRDNIILLDSVQFSGLLMCHHVHKHLLQSIYINHF